jgi:phosphatidylinositol-3-phosphatase
VGTFGVLGLVSCVGVSGCHLIVPPKIMVVMMENQNFSDVIGQPDQPYTNSLASQYGLATHSYAFSHPSLPNYLEIVSGSNHGVNDDNPPSSHRFPGVPTLADQLVSGGYRVAAYAESRPSDPTNDSGLYEVRHNPWEYFPSAPAPVKDSSTLPSDLNGASPPDFVWYTPNVTDDGHTGVPTDTESNEQAGSEAFLSKFIPSVQATAWYKSGGQIIIEWDESRNDSSDVNGGQSGGGHVATIVVSQALKANPRQDANRVATAGILRSIEHLYQVPYLGGASAATNGNLDSLLYW